MKKKYQQPASVAITLQSQLPLAASGYKVNDFNSGGEEVLGGDTPPASPPVTANPVDWNE
ncbi:MAG: hypothetical protein IJ142_06485 [Bacteroidaceae bacterium]|nr:hypothetical protein [Bacteroidaceae bacterium]MBQ9191233.1 hypothetical protein [Bacteroidaceae bacterium]